MGLNLGKLGSSLVSAIVPKPILDQAITALKTVAQGALTIGSGFEGLGKAALDLTTNLANLPGLGDLTKRLLGPGAEALQGLAQAGLGSLEKLLGDTTSKLTARPLENGQSPVIGPLSGRDLQGEFSKIADVLGKLLPQGSTQEGFDAKFKSAVDSLSKIFGLLDTAAGVGSQDGLVGKADLQAALNNPDLPKELKDAIQFLLNNPAAMNKLDVAGGEGKVDGKIGRTDLQAAARSMPAGTGSLTTQQQQVLNQIADPKLRAALEQVFKQVNGGSTSTTGNTGVNPPASNNTGDMLNQIVTMLKQLLAGGSTGTAGTAASPPPATTTTTGSGDVLNQLVTLLKQLLGGGSTGTTGAAPMDLNQLLQTLQSGGLGSGSTTSASPASSPTSYATGTTPASYSSGTPSVSTPVSTTPSRVGGGGSMMDIVNTGLAGANGQVTAQEQGMLDKIQDPNQKAMMKAQMELQHAQEILSFITNMMKKMNEMAMAVIGNLK